MVWISLIFAGAVTAAMRGCKPLMDAAPLKNAAPPAVLRKSRRDQPFTSRTMPLNPLQPTLAGGSRVPAPRVLDDAFVPEKVLKRKGEWARWQQRRRAPAHDEERGLAPLHPAGLRGPGNENGCVRLRRSRLRGKRRRLPRSR